MALLPASRRLPATRGPAMEAQAAHGDRCPRPDAARPADSTAGDAARAHTEPRQNRPTRAEGP